MVGAHPATGGQDGEGRVETVEVEKQRTVVALNQRGVSAVPVKDSCKPRQAYTCV